MARPTGVEYYIALKDAVMVAKIHGLDQDSKHSSSSPLLQTVYQFPLVLAGVLLDQSKP